MKHLFTLITLLFSISVFSQKTIKHDLNVKINPETSEIDVTDKISFPETGEYYFSLYSGLEIVSVSKNAKLKRTEASVSANDVGMDRDNDETNIKADKYFVKLKGKSKSFEIVYKGAIDVKTKEAENNYQRSFGETPGIICDKGIYLAGSTFWVPSFDNYLYNFTVTTELPEGWKTVSQGERIFEEIKNNIHKDTWKCEKPQEEVFLIGARFSEYGYEMTGRVKAMVFLRTPDEGLADKYLDATEQYMQMYSGLLGAYPYSKFALVENFWETGYGMPSFTLLGEKIIRFPFILHSSYPHELLHNWWGNSVYVDFSKGNWCEGITAYLADHLMKEQRGQGEEYRRSTLKKFTDFVTPDNDFPLSKFISRYNAPSEAIGYGKALMVWHMLRRMLGDETFVKGWRKFYQDFKFKKASFEDIKNTFEYVSGKNLDWFFKQWIERTGAPALKIENVQTDRFNDQYRILLNLEQIQTDSAFIIDVPVVVATNSGLKTFPERMDSKKQSYQFFTGEKPLRIAVDPQYDVFRKVDPKEVPPALSKIWASKENVIILPSSAGKMEKEVYLSFADQWKKANGNKKFEIVYDSELKALPRDKTPWIIGTENKFVDTINAALGVYDSFIKNDSVKLGNKILSTGDNSFVITLFDPDNAEKSYIFIKPGNSDAVAGLVRKLPHYGKYSYLAFKGDEPVNITKGMWQVKDSPLDKVLSPEGEGLKMISERKALAYMKPVFSEKRMMNHIKYLSSDRLKGRGLGTPELDSAAKYIAEKFAEYGLRPLGDNYFQVFKHNFPDKPGKKELVLKNVLAMIPGTDPKLREEPVVVSAHYDHLGLGWPDVHAGDKGKIHHGADDNASGVAILLELAKNMAKLKPKRTIVFAAFTGEEAGLVGSKYFVEHANDYFKGKIFADVNIDTDGSLFDKKLMVLNGNTAKEWKFIFMGTDYTTGIKSEVLTTDLDASDQVSFIEEGIPAVQLFTGATQNYHRPTDTWDKIDSKGLVKVATVAKEVVEYLADRTDPMPFTGRQKGESNNKTVDVKKGNRKVATGSVPDFAYAGPGVKIGAVTDDSPAAKAGFKPGDIIVKVNDDTVNDLKSYTVILKKYKPGDKAVFIINRNGKKISKELIFGER